MTQPPAGWYRNPESPVQQKWWDGTAWTDHVRDNHDGPNAVAGGGAKTENVAASEANTAATTGLSLGIASLFLAGIPIAGPVLCISAIITSIVGLRRHQRQPGIKGKGKAIAGLVLGVVYLLLAVFYLPTAGR